LPRTKKHVYIKPNREDYRLPLKKLEDSFKHEGESRGLEFVADE